MSGKLLILGTGVGHEWLTLKSLTDVLKLENDTPYPDLPVWSAPKSSEHSEKEVKYPTAMGTHFTMVRLWGTCINKG